MNAAALDLELFRQLLSDGDIAQVAFETAVRASCENGEESDLFEALGAYGFIEDQVPMRGLLAFLWESWGAPTSSSDGLDMATIGSHRYLILPPDNLEGTHPLFILGATGLTSGREETSELVSRGLMALYGGIYGSRLPSRTSNAAPDLVSRDAVRLAYWTAAQDPETWGQLIGELEELVVHRGLKAPVLSNARDTADEHQRTLLFDLFFGATYSE